MRKFLHSDEFPHYPVLFPIEAELGLAQLPLVKSFCGVNPSLSLISLNYLVVSVSFTLIEKDFCNKKLRYIRPNQTVIFFMSKC